MLRYTVQIDIALPRDKMIALFDNPANLALWQKGFISMEHVSGQQGQPGAVSRLKYQMGNRTIEMLETITVRNLPFEFSGTYDTAGVHNIVKNYFEEIDAGNTRWRSYNEFQLSGFLKIMGWLMPGTFKKQSMQFMQDFKTFAESSK